MTTAKAKSLKRGRLLPIWSIRPPADGRNRQQHYQANQIDAPENPSGQGDPTKGPGPRRIAHPAQ